MKRALLIFFLPAFAVFPVPAANNPRVETRTLPNGLHCLVINFPGSTNVAIFTYSPMSLITDGLGQTQWSHLVEHLVLRSTVPEEDLLRANAETMSDHMR